MNILILHDEATPEAAADALDAVVQANAVRDALLERGHDVEIVPANLDLASLAKRLQDAALDLVFNLTESLGGHGRLIHVVPALLESLRIPFTGVSSTAQLLTSSKMIAKRMMRAAYLPTPPSYELRDVENHDPVGREFVPGRYIIKSIWEHASVGIDDDSIITAEAPWQLREAIDNRLEQLGGEAFAEAYIDGREFNVALLDHALGVQILPPAEILFEGYRGDQPRIVGYRAKWDERSFEYNHTPRRFKFDQEDELLLERMGSLALDCWRLLQLRGYARVDFRVDGIGRPWILEINANPCLSPDAGFAAGLAHAGIGYADAIDRIIDSAVAASSVQCR